MPNRLQSRYIDSVALTRLAENGEGADDVERILQEAAARQYILVISSLTLIEVTRERNKPVDPVKAAKIAQYFENDYFSVRDFHRKLANDAVNLIYDYLWLHPKDAGHLATALEAECVCFYTYDDDLLNRFNGQRGLQVLRPGEPLTNALTVVDELPLFDRNR